MPRAGLLLPGAILLVATCLASDVPEPAATSHLLAYELEDQFGERHQRSDVEGRVVLVIGSDRHGSDYNSIWGNTLSDSLTHHPGYGDIELVPLADLQGVPFFLKGVIRRMFPRQRKRWVLMDWEGVFPKAYGFEPGASNLLVFAPDGSLVHQARGREIEASTLAGLLQALREQLGPH
jgi:hypothetical protein